MDPMGLKRQKPSKRIKNSNCPFSLIVKLSRNLGVIPSLIEIEMKHNHPTQALKVLTFRDINPTVSDEIRTMYEMDHTPARAYRIFLKKLEKTSISDEHYQKLLAGRSQAPRKRDFNNLYTEYKQERFDSKNIQTMFEVLAKSIEKLKQEDHAYVIQFQPYNHNEDDPFFYSCHHFTIKEECS